MARVTVVNDSTEFLDVMGDIIRDLGHEMTGLRAVESSIHEIAETDPELLVIDLRFHNAAQEISGWELLLLARTHSSLQSVPIVLCTADVCEIQQRSADLEEIARVHVLTKPFEIDDMGALIDRLLEERRVAGPIRH